MSAKQQAKYMVLAEQVDKELRRMTDSLELVVGEVGQLAASARRLRALIEGAAPWATADTEEAPFVP